jgi:hypothetical protein
MRTPTAVVTSRSKHPGMSVGGTVRAGKGLLGSGQWQELVTKANLINLGDRGTVFRIAKKGAAFAAMGRVEVYS